MLAIIMAIPEIADKVVAYCHMAFLLVPAALRPAVAPTFEHSALFSDLPDLTSGSDSGSYEHRPCIRCALSVAPPL